MWIQANSHFKRIDFIKIISKLHKMNISVKKKCIEMTAFTPYFLLPKGCQDLIHKQKTKIEIGED